MAAPASTSVNATTVDINYESGDTVTIKVSAISAIDDERNLVTIYHSGDKHKVRFDTSEEADTFFEAIKSAISA